MKVLLIIGILIYSLYAGNSSYINILTSPSKLKTLKWDSSLEKNFLELKPVSNKKNGATITLREDINVSIYNMKFDSIKLLNMLDTNGYKIVLLKNSKTEELCSRGNALLKKVFGEPDVHNDRNGFLADDTSQWVIGNTIVTSWCFGTPKKYNKPHNSFFVSIADRENSKIEIPIVDLECTFSFIVDKNVGQASTKIMRIDETRKALLSQINGRLAENPIFNDSSIEFQWDLSDEKHVSIQDLKIDRFTGAFSGGGAVKNKQVDVSFLMSFDGKCKKISQIEKQF